MNVLNRFGHFRDELADRRTLQSREAVLESMVKQKNSRAGVLGDARDLLSAVRSVVQERTYGVLQSAVSSAVASVYGPEYGCRLDVSEKRGRDEAAFSLSVSGREYELDGAVGGGVVDVAAFAARLALWAVGGDRRFPVFVLDEPFKWLGSEFCGRIVGTVRELVDAFGVQVLMVTHVPELVACGDRVWSVRLEDRVSVVERET